MPEFTVVIEDTTQVYDFEFFLRNTTDYNYSNLFIFLNSTAPDGSDGRRSYEIEIVDEQGQWIGQKSGTLVENILPFKRRKFPLKGKYTFKLELGVTEKEMTDLMDVGLRITKVP
jgi:gliding motility-associated lipoprotein GldH